MVFEKGKLKELLAEKGIGHPPILSTLNQQKF